MVNEDYGSFFFLIAFLKHPLQQTVAVDYYVSQTFLSNVNIQGDLVGTHNDSCKHSVHIFTHDSFKI